MRVEIVLRLMLGLAFLLPAIGLTQSLYQEDRFRTLVGDRKAYRPGDSLTVLVFENASASTSADTTTEKNGGIGFNFTDSSIDKGSAAIRLNDDFNGRGRIQRSGRVLAQLSVTIQSVEPNGELNVMGDQIIEVNSEQQAIRLEGRVRPVDISETNTVPSNRLANARISYVGEGVLGEKQSPGILTRVLSWLGLL